MSLTLIVLRKIKSKLTNMKKLVFSLLIVLMATGVSFAQEQGEIRLGASIALGTKAGLDEGGAKIGPGINVGGEYFITDEISGSLNYTYFFKSSYDATYFGSTVESTSRRSSFNIDGKYYFMSDNVQVYGLAGLAFMNVKSTSTSEQMNWNTGQTETTTLEYKDGETGVNIGGGVVVPLTDVMGFNGQLKYQTPGDGQLVVNAGIVYSLNY